MKTLVAALLLAMGSAPASAQPVVPAADPETQAPVPATDPAPTSAPAPAPGPTTAPPGPALAEDADPALWVVRDDDTIIYLFGTFHLLDGRTWLNDEVKTAFDASGELVLEAIIPEDPASIQPLVLRYAVDPEGRRLSERLNAEQLRNLEAALEGSGLTAAAFEPMEPWFVSMSLAAMAGERHGLSGANGPEAVLLRAARERSLAVDELEGLEWQIRLFDNMPEAQQISQLRQALDDLSRLSESLAPMLAAWSSGDVAALGELVEREGAEDAALYRRLFAERNRNWADWVQRRLGDPGTVFVAVGAGHLAGRDSVQAVLQARGIVAERVPHVEPAIH